MKTYYAWLLSHLYVAAACEGWHEEMSDYTDDFIFAGVGASLTPLEKNDVYTRIFGLWIYR